MTAETLWEKTLRATLTDTDTVFAADEIRRVFRCLQILSQVGAVLSLEKADYKRALASECYEALERIRERK